MAFEFAPEKGCGLAAADVAAALGAEQNDIGVRARVRSQCLGWGWGWGGGGR